MNFEALPQLVTITTAADILGLNQRTVRFWCDENRLKTVQLETGKRRLVPITELARVAKSLGVSPNWEKAF